MVEYIDKEDVLKEAKAWSMFGKDDLVSRLENLPGREIVDDSLILSHEAYSDLCLRVAGRQKASKPNTCGTCKWWCGRKTSVGIECMQPDNQKKWQAKDTPHRECVARYKTAGTTCKRYERIRFAQKANTLVESEILKAIIADFEKMQEHIVRCKDCKWCKHYEQDEQDCYCCTNECGLYDDIAEDDYCSFGERKEEGE